jgi:hypothetical protein
VATKRQTKAQKQQAELVAQAAYLAMLAPWQLHLLQMTGASRLEHLNSDLVHLLGNTARLIENAYPNERVTLRSRQVVALAICLWQDAGKSSGSRALV